MLAQNRRVILLAVGLSVVLSVLSVSLYAHFTQTPREIALPNNQLPANYAKYIKEIGTQAQPVDFSFAAKVSVDAVVHIVTKEKAVAQRPSVRRRGGSPFDDFFDFFDFGPQPEQRAQPRQASGSGVIISENGYIVTNNHVIENSDELKVTLSNKKSYTAKVVGRDANTDLAVLKIDAQNLPFLSYGNSEEVQLGQWVLAIGYPLFLDVTVTAGIVSAKSRSIGLAAQQNGNNLAVESFIQTDAAVNKGNSGGALVNTQGQLIGINSAIASPTGYYSGYSYAIPSNLVKKVVQDIIKYGNVQRAFIGISYFGSEELSEADAQKFPQYKPGTGVLIRDIASDGAAKSAGLKVGDIITKINDVAIAKGTELQEQIGKYHPGDKIAVTYLRNGKTATVSVLLKSQSGTYGSLKFAKLGAEFETLSEAKAREYRVRGGVLVKKVGNGVLKRYTRIRPGFIITKIEDRNVLNVQDLQNAITGLEGRIQIGGFYPDSDGTYFYELDLATTK